MADAQDTLEQPPVEKINSVQNPDAENVEEHMFNDLWEKAAEVSAMLFIVFLFLSSNLYACSLAMWFSNLTSTDFYIEKAYAIEISQSPLVRLSLYENIWSIV